MYNVNIIKKGVWYAIGLEIMGFLIEKIWRMYEPSWTTEISYGAPSDAFKSSAVFEKAVIKKHGVNEIILHYSDMNCPARYFL